jgi:hypothetical protein
LSSFVHQLYQNVRMARQARRAGTTQVQPPQLSPGTGEEISLCRRCDPFAEHGDDGGMGGRVPAPLPFEAERVSVSGTASHDLERERALEAFDSAMLESNWHGDHLRAGAAGSSAAALVGLQPLAEPSLILGVALAPLPGR